MNSQLLDLLSEAHETLAGLYGVFEERNVGDDDLHDPDELDECEAGLCETSAKLLAKIVHLLSEDPTHRTTASTVAHFAETGEFIPRES